MQEYDLKIRQSYHGTGGKDGYRFKVYNHKGKKLGELVNLPSNCHVGDTLCLRGKIYEITAVYDSSNPREEKSEVMYFELTAFTFRPDYEIAYIEENE